MKRFTINTIEAQTNEYGDLFAVEITAEFFQELTDGSVDLAHPTTTSTLNVQIAPLDTSNVVECLTSLAYTAVSALGFDGAVYDDQIPFVNDSSAVFEEEAVITLL